MHATDLAVYPFGGKIYWVQQGEPGTWGTDVWRADLDGSNAERVVHHEFEHHTTGIAIDPVARKLYWATVNYRDA